jgi:hypothetical protein
MDGLLIDKPAVLSGHNLLLLKSLQLAQNSIDPRSNSPQPHWTVGRIDFPAPASSFNMIAN